MQHTNNLTDPQLLAHELHLTANETAEMLGIIDDLIKHVAAPRDPQHAHPCAVCVQIVSYLQHRQDSLKRFSREIVHAILKHYKPGT